MAHYRTFYYNLFATLHTARRRIAVSKYLKIDLHDATFSHFSVILLPHLPFDIRDLLSNTAYKFRSWHVLCQLPKFTYLRTMVVIVEMTAKFEYPATGIFVSCVKIYV
jgi:hypothetical protein